MEELIAYFWRNQGFHYDPTRQYLFGWYHLAMMGLVTLIFIAFWFLGKNKAFRNNTRILYIVGAILLVFELLRVINYRYVSNLTWFNSIQFHMCSIGVYLAIITCVFQKKFLFDIMVAQGLIGAPLAIIIPFGILPYANDFSFMPLQSNISHMLVCFVVIYAIKQGIWRVKLKNYYLAFFSIIITVLILHQINLYKLSQGLGFNNYFWTRYPDSMFPVLKNMSFPYHIIILTFLFILTTFFFYYLGDKITNKRFKRSEKS